MNINLITIKGGEMTIISALMKVSGLRLSYGHKWLVFDEEWIVYEHIHRARNPKILISTESQHEAIEILLMED